MNKLITCLLYFSFCVIAVQVITFDELVHIRQNLINWFTTHIVLNNGDVIKSILSLFLNIFFIVFFVIFIIFMFIMDVRNAMRYNRGIPVSKK